MTGDSGGAVHFPDIPKMALDELIDQLVERAEGVKRAQGRLRSLLKAVESVSGDLSLEQVLQQIATAARTLAGAQYAALGVIAEDRSLERFIHVGMADEVVTEIGQLPEGKGILGALISDAEPIRLRHMSDDDRSVGFPDHHPDMDSFLGVPVNVRGEVYGNLYLTNSVNGEFSAEDEELVIALASAAGTAISNARLYQEAQLRQRWLEATTDVHAQLLTPTGDDPLRSIARHAIDIGDGDIVTIALVDEDRRTFAIECAFGDRAEELVARRFELAGTLTGQVVDSGRPMIAGDARELDSATIFAQAGILEVGAIIAVPLLGVSDHRGVLTLARSRGRRAFTDADLVMAGAFARQAGVALELAEARNAEQKMIMLEERERIARDLHDHVIQELFAIGLSLEGIAGQLAGTAEPLADRLRQRIEDLDHAIRRIRTSIFALHGDAINPRNGLRQAVLEVAASVTPMLGFSPSVSFAGLLDLGLEADITDDAIACVRELLTNVAKHARASSVALDMELRDDRLTISVADDGVGVPPDGRRSGLANLRARAQRNGGSFELTEHPSGGTIATWTVQTG